MQKETSPEARLDEQAGQNTAQAPGRTLQRVGEQGTGLSALDEELLLMLAWGAPLATNHLHRLRNTTRSRWTSQRRLAHLHNLGLVQARYWFEPRPNGSRTQPPQNRGYLWSLTDAGYAALEAHDQRPPRRTKATPPTRYTHDRLLMECVTTLLERTRPTLSGVWLERECQIAPPRRKPTADGFLVLKQHREPAANQPTPMPLPLLDARPLLQEASRAFAIEIDRSTEPLGVIADKAANYRALYEDAAWLRANGNVWPMVTWIVLSERRREAITACWREAWPHGLFYIATVDELHAGTWWEYDEGHIHQRPVIR